VNASSRFGALPALLLVFCVLPVLANRLDKKASGNGVVNQPGGCTAALQIECVAFSITSPTTAEWDHFSFNGVDSVEDGPFTLFLVPTTESATLQLLNANVVFGSFLCGNPGEGMFSTLKGFCTNIPEDADLAAFLSSNPDSPNGSNQATFSFISGASGLPPEWVFYAESGKANLVGASTSVPEPGTVALLGFAFAGVAFLKRRRS
jgi:hypothetical protein